MTAEDVQAEITNVERQLADHRLLIAQMEGSLIAFRYILGKINAAASTPTATVEPVIDVVPEAVQ